MVSIRKLEKILRHYKEYGGFSSQYIEFWLYKKGEVKVKVDELDIISFGKLNYRQALENAAKKLGLI